jgi:hypothetical protein
MGNIKMVRRGAVGLGLVALTFASFAVPSGATAPKVGAGTVGCRVVGRLLFTPPLSATGGATSETVTVGANLVGCHGTGDGATIASGKALGTMTTSSNQCSSFLGATTNPLTARVDWKSAGHAPKLAATTVVYTASNLTGNASNKLQLAETGTATAGSFAGDAASATAVITRALAAVDNACNKGHLASLTFSAAASSASLN